MSTEDKLKNVSPTFGNTVLPAVPAFDYIKCPLHRYTFSVKPIKRINEPSEPSIDDEWNGDVLPF